MELSKNGKFTDESEGAAIKIQAVFRGHRSRQGLAKQSSEDETKNNLMTRSFRGVADLWSDINHIAIVVKDVGTSVAFYTQVIGMTQIMRPDFDRHGAWLSMGNLALHLIKGAPAVHADDDLIVSHIAITIENDQMDTLRERLSLMGVKFRTNVSVPNPATGSKSMDQAFVRDPDGYYIEFCNCGPLEDYLKEKTEEAAQLINNIKSLSTMKTMGERFKKFGASARANSRDNSRERNLNSSEKDQKNPRQEKNPAWMLTDEEIRTKEDQMIAKKKVIDEVKLANLVTRRKRYGDICQVASEAQLKYLLLVNDNKVSLVIRELKAWVNQKGTQTHIPPAFYDRDGSFVQPPSVEIPIF